MILCAISVEQPEMRAERSGHQVRRLGGWFSAAPALHPIAPSRHAVVLLEDPIGAAYNDAGRPRKPVLAMSARLSSRILRTSAGTLLAGVIPPWPNCRSFVNNAALRSGAPRMAAALAGLSSLMMPTRMCRNWTLPESTQGRAASQKALQ